MTKTLYDPEFVAAYFDDFGEREWDRLSKTPADEIKLHVHEHYLKKYIESGQLVLDIGAGAGRFTKTLANLGAEIVVADISTEQLKLNQRFAAEFHFANAVKSWLQLDICNMSSLPDESFAAVICFGGPLGYVFERRSEAVSEVLRVLKPGGKAFFSVSSLWGSIHELLPSVLTIDAQKNSDIVRTGDLYFGRSEGLRHQCHLFRASELKSFLEDNGVAILDISASNCVSAVWGEKLKDIRANVELWNELLQFEVEAAREPGCLDIGTHIIAVVQKPLL